MTSPVTPPESRSSARSDLLISGPPAEQLPPEAYAKRQEAIHNAYGFYAHSQEEARKIAVMHVNAQSTDDRLLPAQRYLDQRVAWMHKNGRRSGVSGIIQGQVDGFVAYFNSAAGAVEVGDKLFAHLDQLRIKETTPFSELIDPALWHEEGSLRDGLLAVTEYLEIEARATALSDEEKPALIPLAGLTPEEQNERIQEVLGVLSAKSLKSSIGTMTKDEHHRKIYMMDRIEEMVATHEFARTDAALAVSSIAKLAR